MVIFLMVCFCMFVVFCLSYITISFGKDHKIKTQENVISRLKGQLCDYDNALTLLREALRLKDARLKRKINKDSIYVGLNGKMVRVVTVWKVNNTVTFKPYSCTSDRCFNVPIDTFLSGYKEIGGILSVN